jgi:RNA polymerase sigma-70 factor, ECF subfamily
MSVRRDQLGEMFRTHGPMVYRRARYILGNHADADDATQDVFLRAMNHLDEFDHKSSTSTWLYCITTNYCINMLRDKKRRDKLLQEKVLPAEQLGRPRSPGEMVAMRQLLAAAPEASWSEAAVLVFIDGMSHQEAAEVLGVSRRTVGNLLNYFTTWAAEQIGNGRSSSPEVRDNP